MQAWPWPADCCTGGASALALQDAAATAPDAADDPASCCCSVVLLLAALAAAADVPGSADAGGALVAADLHLHVCVLRVVLHGLHDLRTQQLVPAALWRTLPLRSAHTIWADEVVLLCALMLVSSSSCCSLFACCAAAYAGAGAAIISCISSVMLPLTAVLLQWTSAIW
jgi:hypothetical protein